MPEDLAKTDSYQNLHYYICNQMLMMKNCNSFQPKEVRNSSSPKSMISVEQLYRERRNRSTNMSVQSCKTSGLPHQPKRPFNGTAIKEQVNYNSVGGNYQIIYNNKQYEEFLKQQNLLLLQSSLAKNQEDNYMQSTKSQSMQKDNQLDLDLTSKNGEAELPADDLDKTAFHKFVYSDRKGPGTNKALSPSTKPLYLNAAYLDQPPKPSSNNANMRIRKINL